MSSTRQRFDAELNELCSRLLAMGREAEQMVVDASRALVQQDSALAASIVAHDDTVDQMERDIETVCLRLLALQQPMASDLRLIETTLKVVADIERIADHAVDIARITQRMHAEGIAYAPLADIPGLAERVRAMLRETLEAYTLREMERVERVIRADKIVDQLYAQVQRDLQHELLKNSSCVLSASYLLFVAHYLERIGDHCVNVAQRVGFIQTGRLALAA